MQDLRSFRDVVKRLPIWLKIGFQAGFGPNFTVEFVPVFPKKFGVAYSAALWCFSPGWSFHSLLIHLFLIWIPCQKWKNYLESIWWYENTCSTTFVEADALWCGKDKCMTLCYSDLWCSWWCNATPWMSVLLVINCPAKRDTMTSLSDSE